MYAKNQIITKGVFSMNLKKIGSALTAITMVASMATYVPVSAATTATETTDTVYEFTLTDTMSDENLNVAISLNVTDSVMTVSNALDADAAYVVDINNLFEDIEYFLTDNNSVDKNIRNASIETLAGYAVTIDFVGDVTLEYAGENAVITNSSATTKVMADCRAELLSVDGDNDTTNDSPSYAVTDENLATLSEYDNSETLATTATEATTEGTSESGDDTGSVAAASFVTTSGVTGEVTHDMEANTTNKNHVCIHGDKIDATYEAHDFEAVKGEGYHACDCGKTDKDYLALNNENTYQAIHGFTNDDHYCDDCGAYDEVYHKKSDNVQYTVTEDTHTVTCKKTGDTDCGYTKEAEVHVWTCNPLFKDGVANTEAVKQFGVATEDIEAGSHYCSTCGYVAVDDEGETANHVYDCKVEAYIDADGNFGQRIVKTDVAAEQVVCECGEVKPGHGISTAHEFIGVNGNHMCVCGLTQTQHSYDYTYTGKGIYEVNGQTGFAMTTLGSGDVCVCGDVNEVHITADADCVVAHISAVSADNTGVIVGQKHYCTCGQEIVDNEKTEDTNEAHYFVANPNTHVHECVCGVTSEEVHVFTKNVVVDSSSDFTGDETSKTYGSYASLTESIVEKDGALCGDCGAVNPAHKHVYDQYVNQKHYCKCGAESTEHSYVVKDTENSLVRCACGAIENHEHVLDENCDCTITGCGATALHDFSKYTNQIHMCVNCGTKAAADEGHTIVADTENHKHVCECGYDASNDTNKLGHKFDATVNDVIDHVCDECGYTNHDKDGVSKTVNGVIKHVCSCGYVYTADEDYGHEYGDNYKCIVSSLSSSGTATACTAVKEHDCAFDHQATADDTANNIVVGDELCKCGKEVAHEFALGTSADKHICTHVNDKGTVDTADDVVCTASADHSFATDAQQKLAVDKQDKYCADCGAVNPALLDEIRAINITDPNGDFVGEYTTAYLVKLTQAQAAVLDYDIVASVTTDATSTSYTYKTITTDTTVKVVKTDAEKTAYDEAVANFKAVLDDAVNNQARSCVIINVAFDKTIITNATNLTSYIDKNGSDYAEYLGGVTKSVYGQVGQEVALSVVPAAGYKVEGWYSDAKMTTKLESTTYTIKDGSYPVYVNIVENDTVNIYLTSGIKYSSTISYTGQATQAFDEDIDFVSGEKVTISSEETGFLYFADNNGNIYSTSNGVTYDNSNSTYSYTFTVTGNNRYSVATSPNTNDLNTAGRAWVLFKNANSTSKVQRTLSSKTFAVTNNKINISNANVSVPAPVGMKFKGWADETAPTTLLKEKAVSANAGQILTLVPVFESLSGLKLTFSGLGSFMNEADKTTNAGAGFTAGTRVAITAPEMSGNKYFSGWYVNGSLMTTERATYYTINDNTTLEAKYEADEPLEEISYSTLTLTEATNASGVRVVNFASKWKILDSAEILEVGYVFSFDGITGDALNVNNGNVKIRPVDSTSANSEATYSPTLSSAAVKNATVNAKSYVKYRSTSGEEKIVYSVEAVSTPAN